MKPEQSSSHDLTTPRFLSQASHLNSKLRRLSIQALENLMNSNAKLTTNVQRQLAAWHDDGGTAAALTFRGDIYSGLATAQWNEDDAIFAQHNLLILSGLYGILRPFDQIQPYRLEMGYRLNGTLLSDYWQKELVGALDKDIYVNLTAKEYFVAVKKQLNTSRVISPKFLTISHTTKQPVFVTVHAKIARGSFAGWLIKQKVQEPRMIPQYNLLGYTYNEALSSDDEPVFICEQFKGLGLSVRLT